MAVAVVVLAGCGDDDTATGESGDAAALLVVVIEDTRNNFSDVWGARYEMVFDYDEDGTDSYSNLTGITGNYHTSLERSDGRTLATAGSSLGVGATATADKIEIAVQILPTTRANESILPLVEETLSVAAEGETASKELQLAEDLIAHVELRWVEADAFELSGKTITLSPSPAAARLNVGGVGTATYPEVAFGTGRDVSPGQVELTNIEIINDTVEVYAVCRAHGPATGNVPVGTTWSPQLGLINTDPGIAPADCDHNPQVDFTITIDLEIQNGSGVDNPERREPLVVTEQLTADLFTRTRQWELCVGGETRARVDLEYEVFANQARPLRADVQVEQFEGASCGSTDSDGTNSHLFALEAGESDSFTVNIDASNLFGGNDHTKGTITVTHD